MATRMTLTTARLYHQFSSIASTRGADKPLQQDD